MNEDELNHSKTAGFAGFARRNTEKHKCGAKPINSSHLLRTFAVNEKSRRRKKTASAFLSFVSEKELVKNRRFSLYFYF